MHPKSSPQTAKKVTIAPDKFTVEFWGVRGEIPTPGRETMGYGGNTSCVTMRVGNQFLIFDAGTGVRVLGKHLLSQMPVEAHLFLTHCHWDRIQGFPFFVPGFIPINRFHIYGASAANGASMEQRLFEQMLPPNFPVPIGIMGSDMKFYALEPGSELAIGEVEIETVCLNPTNCATGYRVSCQGHTAVYATDTLLLSDRLDKNLLHLARNADVLIYDGTIESASDRFHSFNTDWKDFIWKTGIEVAKAASVQRLVICHHDPGHNDRFLELMEAQLKSVFPHGLLAREGMSLEIGN